MTIDSASLLDDIARAGNVDALCTLTLAVPRLLATLVDEGQPAGSIGDQISVVGEAITRRLLELAEQQLGPPPVAYAFVVAGSLARREQNAGSDQDNALVLADDYRPTDHEAYFRRLGQFVCTHLEDCGYTLCPGDIMASNDKWRMTWSQWQSHFRRWVDEPDPKALLELCIFFDLRHQHGDPTLVDRLRSDFLERTRASPLFLAHLAAAAQNFRPALGWFGRLQFEHDSDGQRRIDLKKQGITPVVDIARTHALARGIDLLSTVERLQALTGLSDINDGEIAELIQAFESISMLRLNHQARRIRCGARPDYRVIDDELSRRDRKTLKRSFMVVAAAQQALLRRFQAEAFR